ASMAVYTVATVAFYLLGAGILHARGTVPASRDMVPVLSTIYTGTLGPWVLPLFYQGAVVVLYGTVFAATAAHSRLFADMCRVMGLSARDDDGQRLRDRRAFVVLLTVLPAALYLVFASPVKMVVAGGVVQSVMLPVVGFGTLYLRYRRLPADLAPSAGVTAGLWIASAVMLGATAVYARSVLWP
ncbi:MAG: transmembrane Mn(2+) transporter, partial [Vicinamibacteria bacterium]